MQTGRLAKATDFAARVAEAAKRRHSQTIERETLPEDLAQTITDLVTQVLYLRGEVDGLKASLGDFYRRIDRGAA